MKGKELLGSTLEVIENKGADFQYCLQEGVTACKKAVMNNKSRSALSRIVPKSHSVIARMYHFYSEGIGAWDTGSLERVAESGMEKLRGAPLVGSKNLM